MNRLKLFCRGDLSRPYRLKKHLKKIFLLSCFSLLLVACASEPDLRPNAYLRGEDLLQQGLEAYRNDDFMTATAKFTDSFKLYQSFDNQKGMVLSQLNLIEAALAVSDFKQAEFYLQPLTDNALEQPLKNRVVLLHVRLLFQQENYSAALASLQPLLATIATEIEPINNKLNLLAMAARLEVLISPLTSSAALAQFQSELAKLKPVPPAYQAVLNRILAWAALKQGHYQTAQTLLNQALDYYKEVVNRRAIAGCLEDLAELEIAQQHSQAAAVYWHKALTIRLWLKDQYNSDRIQQQLQAIKGKISN
jgi:uncharacterized protein HemY